jgi:hypothetical protein
VLVSHTFTHPLHTRSNDQVKGSERNVCVGVGVGVCGGVGETKRKVGQLIPSDSPAVILVPVPPGFYIFN